MISILLTPVLHPSYSPAIDIIPVEAAHPRHICTQKPSIFPTLHFFFCLYSHQVLTVLQVLREPPFSSFDNTALHIKEAQLLAVK